MKAITPEGFDDFYEELENFVSEFHNYQNQLYPIHYVVAND